MLKQNVGWAWSMRAGRPKFCNGAMHNVQYQFEVNRCRNEEVNFQGFSANSVIKDSGQDERTDRQTAKITTLSPRSYLSINLIVNVVPVDLSINLKEDGNQTAFPFINSPWVGNVDMEDVQY
ncbi:hypothetical protein DPMN_061938 [Dreissena polymorpha]|uniref:Uncharacterized protein n=1 Tax=Dreissena polymorpha TaxID=45954 RepID=A0A9D4C8H9_DREPO|nr:hypothetical protein DPMN_061938 [Dreissena polymorpha]